ncbi:MAG: serine--tRNA ligase, partial [Neisseriaceae bacterium]
MLDINLLRNDIDAVVAKLAVKNFTFNKELFFSLEDKRKKLQMNMEELQAKRNSSSKEIGVLKSKRSKEYNEEVNAQYLRQEKQLLSDVAGLGEQLKQVETEFNEVALQLNNYLATVPNIPDASVPAGRDESANVEVRRIGVPRDFDFQVKDHVDLGLALDRGIDFEAGAKVAGSRFAFLKGKIAKLHR